MRATRRAVMTVTLIGVSVVSATLAAAAVTFGLSGWHGYAEWQVGPLAIDVYRTAWRHHAGVAMAYRRTFRPHMTDGTRGPPSAAANAFERSLPAEAHHEWAGFTWFRHPLPIQPSARHARRVDLTADCFYGVGLSVGWLIGLPTTVLTGAVGTLLVRRRRRPRPGHCRRCGYDLRASPGRCPECGTAAAVAPVP